MKKTILITGSNGMLARQLLKILKEDYSLRFLTRKVTREGEYLWDVNKKYINPEALIGVNYIIHLAGAGIADKRWSKSRKEIILSSRVDSARLILDELKNQNHSLDAFISASAIGYYGTNDSDEVFNESHPNGNDFLSEVCYQWEAVANQFKSENVATRVAVVRIGVILAKNDGALKKLIKPIKYGIGSGLGSGKQFMPWIHIDDLSRAFKFVLENNEIIGPYNAVAPDHVTNIEMTKKIAKVINRKIILPNVPSFVIRTLFGEMATMLLNGNRVDSNKIIASGFNFEFKKVEDALEDVL